MSYLPRYRRRAVKSLKPEGVETIPIMPQLEDGEIYLDGHTFRYWYGIDGKLWLRLCDVASAFGVLSIHEASGTPPELMRYVVTRILTSPDVPVGLRECKTLVVGPAGVDNLSNRARKNRKLRKAILRLFREYGKEKHR